MTTVKLIDTPTVRLITRPAMDAEELEEFLLSEGLPPASESIRAGEDQASAIAEASGRIFYMSFGRGRRDISAFIQNLLAHKDGSVFEHINYGFVFTGISRTLSHELVRHRAGFAYSQKSQRYVDENKGAAFVVPPAILGAGGSALETFRKQMEHALMAYKELVDDLSARMPTSASMPATERRKSVR